jgi:hypothetical protein
VLTKIALAPLEVPDYYPVDADGGRARVMLQ